MSDTNSKDPAVAENGDKRNRNNDGDGRKETVYVEGHLRKGKLFRVNIVLL